MDRARLTDCFGEDAAGKVLAILDGSLDPESFEPVERWLSQCFHRPSDTELEMCAFNAILDGYGIEGIRDPDAHVDNYHFDVVASYVNMGDTYAATIIRDHLTGEYVATDYGTWLEGYEQENGEIEG